MAYKHPTVQALADFITEHEDDIVKGLGEFMGKDMAWRAIWIGIRRQVPGFLHNQVTSVLQALDDNPEAVADIQKKMREVLDIPPPAPAPIPMEKVIEVAKEAAPKRGKKKVETTTEVAIIVEPSEEEGAKGENS